MFSGKFLVWGCFTNIYSLTDSYTFSGTPQFLEPGALVQMCKSKHIALVAPTYTPTRVIQYRGETSEQFVGEHLPKQAY